MSIVPESFHSRMPLRDAVGFNATTRSATAQAPDAATKGLATADKAASGLSLAAEVFMKKGVPKMTAQLFTSKVGMFGNLYSSGDARRKGDTAQAGISLLKGVASLGAARFYNLADGVGNAHETYSHYQASNFQSAMHSGTKLLLNVGGAVSPHVAIASAVFQLGTQLANPE